MKTKTLRTMNQRRGAMLPLLAVTMIFLMIGVIFSIDIAYMHMVRAELRTATDAAARAGAETLARTQDVNSAIDSALEVANLNNVSGNGLQLRRDQVVLGSVIPNATGKFEFTPGATPLTSVRVIGERTESSLQGAVPLFFGQFLNQTNFQPAQVATATSSVRDIALILDRSGSMSKPSGSRTRIEDLKAAVNVFLAEVKASSPTSTISLTTYSTESTRDFQLTNDFREIQEEVNNMNPEGWTNIFKALQDGSDSLISDPLRRAHANKTIILMTDGNYNVGGTPMPSAINAAERGHTIHTITFSEGANQEIMQRVAEVGKGRHIHADNGDDLAEAFREIARTLGVTLTE